MVTNRRKHELGFGCSPTGIGEVKCISPLHCSESGKARVFEDRLCRTPLPDYGIEREVVVLRSMFNV